ncbi:MAG: hypothetical protein M3Q23_13130 [Actinomycetota bacterium]|nr:hypothetical protein [Actinomycetota bacterium]
MLLLASGLERLMKVVLCLAVLQDQGRFPNPSDIPATHDLVRLLDVVIATCFDDAYLERPAAQEDLAYIRDDERLRQVVRALAEFGDQARYYNLDVVTGRSLPFRPPDEAWGDIEHAVLEENPFWVVEFTTDSGLEAHSDRMARTLVVAIERLIRALVRLFTLSRIAPEARLHTGRIASFLRLTDEHLGSTLY